MNLVRQIAIARWQIERLHTATTNVWNFALLTAAGEPFTVVEEMEDAQAAARAAEALFSGTQKGRLICRPNSSTARLSQEKCVQMRAPKHIPFPRLPQDRL